MSSKDVSQADHEEHVLFWAFFNLYCKVRHREECWGSPEISQAALHWVGLVAGGSSVTVLGASGRAENFSSPRLPQSNK